MVRVDRHIGERHGGHRDQYGQSQQRLDAAGWASAYPFKAPAVRPRMNCLVSKT